VAGFPKTDTMIIDFSLIFVDTTLLLGGAKTLREVKKHIKVMKKLRDEPVPQWLHKVDPLSLNNRLLSFCGLLPTSKTTTKIVYMTVCTIIIITTMTTVTGTFIKAYLSKTNFMAVIECMTIVITQLKCLLKFSVLLIYRNDLRFVINTLKENFYVHESMFKNEILAKIQFGKRVAWWITVPYISVFIGTVVAMAAEKIAALRNAEKLSFVADGTNITKTFRRNFPLKIWVPLDADKSPSYEIGFLYQILSFAIEVYGTCVIDMFIVVLIMFTAIQFELLVMAVQLPADTVAMRLGIYTAPSQGK
jgi:hypothetical protein